MRYSERRYTGPDGSLSLYARDYEGDGPPLLMMHGLTRNSGDFDGLAAHLAGSYRLIVPDQRGRGLSDYDPDPSRYPSIAIDPVTGAPVLNNGQPVPNLGTEGTLTAFYGNPRQVYVTATIEF